MPTIKEKIDEILERHYYERLEAIGINLYELGKWYSKVYVSLPIIDSSIKSFNHSEAFKLFQEFKKMILLIILKEVILKMKMK